MHSSCLENTANFEGWPALRPALAVHRERRRREEGRLLRQGSRQCGRGREAVLGWLAA